MIRNILIINAYLNIFKNFIFGDLFYIYIYIIIISKLLIIYIYYNFIYIYIINQSLKLINIEKQRMNKVICEEEKS